MGDTMNNLSADQVFDALLGAFDLRGKTAGLIDIRRSPIASDTALLMFRWPPQDQLFGVPISFTRIERRLDWDRPARDLDDWLDSVELWILEDVENGFSYRARRRAVDDYIELSTPGWPDDRRFYLQVNSHLDTDTTLLQDLHRVGLDAELALEAQHAGRLLAWIFAYENNSTGSPIVGHSTVIRSNSHVPRLANVALAADVPPTVAVALVRSATHTAADNGAEAVEAEAAVIGHLQSLHPDIPKIAGFVRGPDGHRVATNFLTEDPTLADHLFRDALNQPGRWGGDRDRVGRYLPKSGLLRAFHRVRHGTSGTPPRMYAG
jgi:hypothetical protein